MTGFAGHEGPLRGVLQGAAGRFPLVEIQVLLPFVGDVTRRIYKLTLQALFPSTQKTTTPKRKRTRRARKTPSVPVEERVASPAPATPTPNPTPTPDPTPAHAPSRPRNQTTQRTSRPPLQTRQGIVIHGVALRKDLEKVRKWLEEDNKELGKMTTGIRWLRRKATLEEEGKKASSIVLYTKARVEIGRVRLGGKLLRSEGYEPNRKRE
ncbi:hypothetical protein BDZ91DRAFT_795322 [Kalaharituber pfeilii]|nr:hypothetical protein BDZ91DRAFT_795322 [Kalaharituber pfeilii]